MRLVFVHGRAQEGRSAAEIEHEWLTALHDGYTAAGVSPPHNVDLRVPFYGDRLDELTAQMSGGLDRVIERGSAAGVMPDEFEVSFIRALAERAGVTDDELHAELTQPVIERGPQNWEWVHAIARVLSRRAPWLGGQLLAQLTADVNIYLSRPHVTQEINAMVALPLRGAPAVVVGHSLGSIVAYWVLQELGHEAEVPLFVTVGSPLGIDVVKQHLPRPMGKPVGVRHWLNGADERDPVALYSRLDRDIFPADIENVSDIHNPREWPHSISGYLRDRIIAGRIAAALKA